MLQKIDTLTKNQEHLLQQQVDKEQERHLLEQKIQTLTQALKETQPTPVNAERLKYLEQVLENERASYQRLNQTVGKLVTVIESQKAMIADISEKAKEKDELSTLAKFLWYFH